MATEMMGNMPGPLMGMAFAQMSPIGTLNNYSTDLLKVMKDRLDAHDGQLLEGAWVVALAGPRDGQRHDPVWTGLDALAQQPDLRLGRSELDLPLGRGDRLLLGDAHLVLLAATRDREGQGEQQDQHADASPAAVQRPAALGGRDCGDVRRWDGTRPRCS